MNKLPKEIYVREESDGELKFFDDPEKAALPIGTVVLAVYKLVGKVEVSTEMRREVIVKKSPKKTKTESIPVARNPLLQEMRVMEVIE